MLVDLVDETYVVAPPHRLAPVFADPRTWAAWWPDLTLEVAEDRGLKGMRWRVTGSLAGTSEVWLEPHRDGTVVHLYLRLDPATADDAGRGRRAADRLRRGFAVDFKRRLSALKDELEAGRELGVRTRSRREGASGGERG
ncbi:MAG: polyketide cyclase / dehydrase and lipid transport [Streptosporangiales bacterium]|nr:polyketide cyclase / dehydrase and lipid transport [Streptosporangiales bacterium]